MKRSSATDILRDHARERWLRRAIRSVNLDGDRGTGAPRMGEAAWVDSCHLVRGVPAELLDVLGVRECEASEATWSRIGIDLPDRTVEVPTEQLARPLKLEQAARRLGLERGHAEMKAMRLAAIATVTENLLRRQARNGVAA